MDGSNLVSDKTHPTNVTGRSEPKIADETRAHIGKNVTVEVRHYHDTVGVRLWVLRNLRQAHKSE